MRCGACLTLGSALDSCCAAVDYGYPWQQLILRFKYSDAGDLSAQPALAKSLAQVIVHVAAQDSSLALALRTAQRCDHLLPMPLHPARQSERGFNQAASLAHALFPNANNLRTDLLVRTKNTATQADLPRDLRMANLYRAFLATPLLAHELKGASVMLIDDVTTTTATLSAAAAALRQAGAKEVHAIVFARTVQLTTQN